MIDKEFIQEIERLDIENDVRIKKDGAGREYFTSAVVKNPPPTPEVLKISTLDGLVDMVQSEKLECSAFIHGPRSVSLIGPLDEKWRQRETYAKAIIEENGFRFGNEMPIEEFIINLQCNFEDTPEKKKVIDFVASISAQAVTTAEDDGIAQEVVARQSIGTRKEKVQLDPIVELVPFRTFREVEQTPDKFLLRMHNREGGLPFISLRSAGGEIWKQTAIKAIYTYLTTELQDNIPVIR